MKGEVLGTTYLLLNISSRAEWVPPSNRDLSLGRASLEASSLARLQAWTLFHPECGNVTMSRRDLEGVLNELRRQVVAAGFGELDSAIIQLEGEVSSERETTIAGRQADEMSDAMLRLMSYVEHLEETLGSSDRSGTYVSTISMLNEHVVSDERLRIRLVLPRTIGQGSIDFTDLPQPTDLLNDIRDLVNDILEGR